jgi:glycosyltransferase involved in cell wall biosynthesis
MKKIEFTLLVPIFNTSPKHLFECMESIEGQTVGNNFPIILIDDGSTNVETLKAIEMLERQNPAQITALRLETNGGTSKALNAGHAIAQTEYVALTGSQDISHPQRFEKQIRYLKLRPELDVLGTQLFSFLDSDPKKKPFYTTTHPQRYNPFPVNGWATNHGTVFYKNQSVKDVAGYVLPGRAQDIDLWRRMNAAGKTIETMNEVLYAWRKDSK